ncbi:hypothetical protein Tco_1464418 [Tanacetum coccineum]
MPPRKRTRTRTTPATATASTPMTDAAIRALIVCLPYQRMFPDESDKVKKYVGGLPDLIQGSMMASKPKEIHDAIEFLTELVDQKIRTLVERQIENKMKQDDNFRDNQN